MVLAIAIAQKAVTFGSEPSHFDSDIAQLQAALNQATTPEERELLQAKLELYEADRAAELEGRKPQSGDLAAKARDGQQPDDQPQKLAPTTPVPGGVISEYGRPIDGSKDFVSSNSWIKELGDQKVLIVFAGRSTSQLGVDAAGPEVGMVKVYEQGYYGSSVSFIGAFKPAQDHPGALRVIDANGDVITLQAADGAILTLDASTLRFTD
jgi:hypothetical protein